MTHDTEVTGLLTEHDGSERRISLDGQQDVLESKQRVQDEAELVRLLDRRLLPMIVAIFVMNYVDRTAIAAARLRGLEEDLHLTRSSFSVCPSSVLCLGIPTDASFQTFNTRPPSQSCISAIALCKYRAILYVQLCRAHPAITDLALASPKVAKQGPVVRAPIALIIAMFEISAGHDCSSVVAS